MTRIPAAARVAMAGGLAALLVASLAPAVRAQAPTRLRIDTTASHDGFGLLPASGVDASYGGRVTLRQAWSPFGVSVTRDGFTRHDLTVEVAALPPAAPGERYVAWLATPTLDTVVAIGTVVPGVPLAGTSTLNRMLVVVSRETGEPGDRWRGPILLRGRSRSALLQSLMGHSIFRRAEF